MAINFITARTESILSRAKFPQDSYNVPNDHKCFDDEQLALWQQLADCFGINFEDTGHTIRASVKGSEVSLYTPYVGSDGTQAVLVWGKVKKPLSEVDSSLVEMRIGGGKRPALECDILPLDGETLVLTLMLGKGDKEDSPKEHQELAKADEDGKKTLLRKAYRTGKLHLYLSQSFERAKKLADIAGTTVDVFGYSINRWGKYELETSEGLVVGNTAIARKLDKSPVISKEYPATLEVGQSTGKTSTGYDIYPAILTTHADRELPVFDFGADSNVEADLEFA